MSSLRPESKRVITPRDARGPKATQILIAAIPSVPIAVGGMFVAVYFFGDFAFWIAALAAAGMGVAETVAWAYVYNTVKRGEIEARREGEESGP